MPPAKPIDPKPVAAAAFHLCFFDSGATHDCVKRTGIRLWMDVPGSGLTSRVIDPLSWLERLKGKRIPRIDYEFTAVLPADLLDRNLQWTVIACGQPPRQGCAQGRSRQLSLTARDLAIKRIDSQRQGQLGVAARIEVRNDGRTVNDPYEIVTEAWEVLPDAGGGDTLRDINDPAVLPTDTVVTVKGETYTVAEYRTSGRATGDIRGFHRAGSFAHTIWHRHESQFPPGVPIGQPLQPGTCANDTDPCPSTAQSVLACDGDTLCYLAAQRTTRPTAFVMHARLLLGNLPDFDPSDNEAFKGRIILN